MGFLDLFKRSGGSWHNPSVSLSDADDFFDAFGRNTNTGVPVTSENSLTVTAYLRALSIISQTISSFPLKIYKKTSEGREEATDHRLYTLFNDFNNIQTNKQFLESFQLNLCHHGNGIAKLNKKGGIVQSITLVSHDKLVGTIIKGDSLYLRLRNKDGVIEELNSRDYLFVNNLSMGGTMGRGWLDIAKETISNDLAQAQYSGAVYKNGGNLSGMLTTSKTLKVEAQKEIRKEWDQKYSGAGNAHKTAILHDGLEYKPISLTPEQTQMIESKKISVQEFSRISGVPAHMVGDNSHATFSNIEHQSTEFITYTMLHWVKKHEEEFEKKLLSSDEKGQYFIRYSMNGILRGDTKTRTAYYSALLDRGAITRNEVRALEEFNKIEGGDEPLIALNMGGSKMNNEKEDEE